MAEKGKIKNIKDNNTGTADAIVTAPSDGSFTITITDKKGVDISGKMYSPNERCLHIGDEIRFQTITAGGVTVPVHIERITAGTIATINPDGYSGTITEKISGKLVYFMEPYLKELNLTVNSLVKYTLVPDVKVIELAVDLDEVTG